MNWRKPIIYALLYLTRSKIPAKLKEIKRLAKLSQKEAKDYQEEKLKKLLLHAWKNVPYYNKALEKTGVVKEGIVNLKNFNKIPILTKEIIRREGKNLYSKDYNKRKPYENTSGGSTGEPVRFIQDKNYDEWNIANKIYYKSFGNQKIGYKELRLWGSERDILEGKEKFSIRLRNWIYRRKELNSFRMSNKDMLDFVKKWNNFKPKWVEAYAQSIYEFAKFLDKNKLFIHSPKGILTSAGTLYPEMKKTISNLFKCKVYNRYGSREVGDIACSDQSGKGLKISFWNQYLEVLDQNLKEISPNEAGKIYVTTLNNYSMPLIRYDIGDMGVKDKSSFYLREIKGRNVSLFKKKDGTLIDGEYFTHLFYFADWVKKFQIIQKDYDLIICKIALHRSKDMKQIKKIEHNIRALMGEKSKIKWEFVKDIAPTKSGKYLYTTSEVK